MVCQSSAEILLLLAVSENKRPPSFDSGFDFYGCITSACHFASAYQISSKSDHPRQNYDVISISQNRRHCIAILIPVSVYVISLIWEGWWDITTSGFWKQTFAMLDFYFRFRFFALASPSACHSASAYQISSKSDHPGRSYDVVSIF